MSFKFLLHKCTKNSPTSFSVDAFNYIFLQNHIPSFHKHPNSEFDDIYRFLSAITQPTRKNIFIPGRNGITRNASDKAATL